MFFAFGMALHVRGVHVEFCPTCRSFSERRVPFGSEIGDRWTLYHHRCGRSIGCNLNCEPRSRWLGVYAGSLYIVLSNEPMTLLSGQNITSHNTLDNCAFAG